MRTSDNCPKLPSSTQDNLGTQDSFIIRTLKKINYFKIEVDSGLDND